MFHSFFRKFFRLLDFFAALVIAFIGLLILLIRRCFGKFKLKPQKNCLLSISKDGINRIIECNPPGYLEWYFKRPHAEKTYVLYLGNEKSKVFRFGKKVVGINILMPLDRLKRFLPFTARTMQQLWGLAITLNVVRKISPKVVEVMFPTKLALRAMLLKWLMPIKLVTQVRGNFNLIYYFNPFPTFFPFKIKTPFFEVLLITWDNLISFLFYRSCDRVIGYNLNNMLSAISSGASPQKAKLSRIKIDLSMLNIQKQERNQLQELPQTGKIISLWSRLAPEKLVLETVQAFEKLCSMTKEELYYVIIGDGPEKSKIQSYISNSPFQERFILLGYRNRAFIAQTALHSSLAIISYGGSSLVEAVLLEVPVVAFDIEWHNELIRDGETGYLADFPDTAHMAEKMFKSINDPARSKEMVCSAKNLAQRMFDVKVIDLNESRYYLPLFE
ncbi:glycosyltransferase [Legionella shakespearei]|uniref:Alpha-D-kanosaminyltransferase n=1 Tax=Legionella shakespearei DSM 23087 TaxID=1122169 RepID=A0A0W0YV31_9GAMM|nr:glycosyltransferase [Legionella shakespearei]KTD60722.1 Alpha-D-kanosaminyltransferase [Legionella shakespearei DSM 23087]